MANTKETPVANEITAEESEGRRSFMKGIVAGSVAAGALASTVANAAPAQFQAVATNFLVVGKPRPESAKLRVSFDFNKQPKLYELQKALEDILRPTGCPNCGLGGIDIYLRLDQLINPAERFMAVAEGQILQR